MKGLYIEDAAWSKIYDFLQEYGGLYVRDEEKTRRFIEAVYWMMRTGAQWNALPSGYGFYKTVHKRYNAWSGKGVWQAMMAHFAEDADGEWIMLDSTITRAHPCAAGYEAGQQEREALGRSKGGFTTKIHALVDALGNPLRFRLTGGHRNDITQAEALIEGMEHAVVLADKGYDADAFIQRIEKQNGRPVIPTRKNRKTPRAYDTELYKERNLVERFFKNIKNFRRIFSRFDKKALNYLSFIAFAATILWLK